MLLERTSAARSTAVRRSRAAGGERVFVTQAIESENRRAVICFARRDGSLVWQSGVAWPDREPTHPDNPACTPSPVTDGRRVIAWFGSAGDIFLRTDRSLRCIGPPRR